MGVCKIKVCVYPLVLLVLAFSADLKKCTGACVCLFVGLLFIYYYLTFVHLAAVILIIHTLKNNVAHCSLFIEVTLL